MPAPRAACRLFLSDGRLTNFGSEGTYNPTVMPNAISDDGGVVVAEIYQTFSRPTDPNYYGNYDAVVFAGAAQDLTLTIGDAGEAGATGGDLIYPITIHNGSPDTAKRVVLRAEGVFGADAKASTVGGSACTIISAGGFGATPSYRCAVGDIAAGATATGSVVMRPSFAGTGIELDGFVEADRADYGSGSRSSERRGHRVAADQEEAQGRPGQGQLRAHQPRAVGLGAAHPGHLQPQPAIQDPGGDLR